MRSQRKSAVVYSTSYSVGSNDQFQGLTKPYHYPPYSYQAHRSGNLSMELQHSLHSTQSGVLDHGVFPVRKGFYHHTSLGFSHGHRVSHNITAQHPDIYCDQGEGLLANTSLATLKCMYFAGTAPASKSFKRAPSAQPPLGQVQLSPHVIQQVELWKLKLSELYLTEESKSDAWPPLKMINFVQLALVQQEKHARHLDLRTPRRDIDEVYGQKNNVTYKELFKRLHNSSLILIEGRPGSGKTTLLVRISCD